MFQNPQATCLFIHVHKTHKSFCRITFSSPAERKRVVIVPDLLLQFSKNKEEKKRVSQGHYKTKQFYNSLSHRHYKTDDQNYGEASQKEQHLHS